MPFCTAVRARRTPTSARFCAQCGTLARRRRADAGGRVARRVHRHDHLRRPGKEAEHRTSAPSATPTRPRSTRCRRAPPCWSCSAAPTPAAASCSTPTWSTAGRHPDSDIFLDDVTVSRRHAEFRRDGGRLRRRATSGSLNGTYVNRERIDEAALAGGDEVQIGKFRLVFFAGHAARA